MVTKRSLAIVAVWFFLHTLFSSPAYAWVASRFDLSNYWVITCNDGESFASNHEPDFFTGSQICAKHGGLIARMPGGLDRFALLSMVPLELLSPVSVGDFFSAGQITAGDAFQLTNSPDPRIWSTTLLEFKEVLDPGSFVGVSAVAMAVELPNSVPEPGTLGLLVVGLTVLSLVSTFRLLTSKREGRSPRGLSSPII